MLHVTLHSALVELPADQSLGVEDGVVGIDGNLVLCRVSNQPFGVCKCHVGWCGPVTLVIGDDLHLKDDNQVSKESHFK